MSLPKELRSRYHSKFEARSTSKAAKLPLWAALDAVDQLAAKRAVIAANKNLSDAGKKAELQGFASGFAPTVARARGAVAGAKSALARQREALLPSVTDRTDVAAAMLRDSYRRFFRGQSQAEIARLVENDPIAMTAIFEAAPQLSGLTRDSRDLILNAYLQRHCAPQLAAIADQAEAVELLEIGVNVASDTLADALGIRSEQLESHLAEKAPKEAEKGAELFAVPAAASAPVKARGETSEETYQRYLAEARVELVAAGLI